MNPKQLILALATGIAVFGLSERSMAQDKTAISFRLDFTVYGTHAPFFLAKKNGLYAAEGLNVTFGEGQGSATVARLVAQGNDQMGFVDFGSTARGVEQGLPIKAIMRVVSDVLCMISRANAPVKEPKDLVDKVVAFAPTESTAQIFPALLASQNVDPKSVSVLSPAHGAKNAMFLQGKADAIPGFYTLQVAQLEQAGASVHYFLLSDYGLSQMNNGVVANKDFLAKNPNAARGFLKATAKGFELAKADSDAAVAALIEAYPEQARNRAVLKRQLELSMKALTTKNTLDKPFGYMDERDWEQTQKIHVTYGGMPRSLPVAEFYTNEFLPK